MNIRNLFLRRLWLACLSSPAMPRTRPDARRFRPSVLVLEDRTVPAADMFADATVLSGTFVTNSGDNTDASAETGEVAPLSAAVPINSVWWKWTAASDGLVEVNTLGSEL